MELNIMIGRVTCFLLEGTVVVTALLWTAPKLQLQSHSTQIGVPDAATASI